VYLELRNARINIKGIRKDAIECMEICTDSSIIPLQILRKIMEVVKTDGKQVKEE